MSAPNPLTFRPRPTGNAAYDEAMRQILDYVYQLRAQVETLQAQVLALQVKVGV